MEVDGSRSRRGSGILDEPSSGYKTVGYLRVKDGCGLQVKPVFNRGFFVEAIEARPGQPDLRVDDFIIGINGKSLIVGDTENYADIMGGIFRDNRKDNVRIDILRGSI
jgi:hypothetical protein